MSALDPNRDDWSLFEALTTEVEAHRAGPLDDTAFASRIQLAVFNYLEERADDVVGVRLYDGHTHTWLHTDRQVQDWLRQVFLTEPPDGAADRDQDEQGRVASSDTPATPSVGALGSAAPSGEPLACKATLLINNKSAGIHEVACDKDAGHDGVHSGQGGSWSRYGGAA